MPKVTITLSEEIWKWWKDNPWINLSQLAERELNRIRTLEERVLGTCPKCGNLFDELYQHPHKGGNRVIELRLVFHFNRGTISLQHMIVIRIYLVSIHMRFFVILPICHYIFSKAIYMRSNCTNTINKS